MLNWIRDKFFKRPSSGASSSNIAVAHSNSVVAFSSSEKLNMLSELTPKQIKDKITLTIIFDGETWTINVDYYQVISNLIDLALNHFYDPTEAFNDPSKYKMISISNKKVLSPLSTIADEHLNHGGKFRLI